MHHAPSGPPLSRRLVSFVRRSRLLPLTVGGLVIAGMALAGPPSDAPAQTGTAALTAPSEGDRELVPATGDGWTQDGRAPAPVEPADPAPGVASADDAPAADETAPDAADHAPAVTAPGTSSAPPASSAGTTSTSAGPRTSTGGTSSPPSSSPAPMPAPAPVVVPGAADEALAAVNTARTESGCAPLTADAALAGAATAHSTAMRDAAAPVPPAGAGLVAGPLTDPAAVAAAWLADPSLPLTDCALTTAGVGAVDGWWTLLVA